MTRDHLPQAKARRLAGALAACIVMMPFASTADEIQARTPDVVSSVLETSIGNYTFTPDTCIIYMEDGVPDIEIAGPGLAWDGESFHFDFSSTANEMTIELGVSEPYQSADRTLQAGRYVSTAFEIDVSDGVVSATGLDLVNEQGEQVDGSASLRIDCNKPDQA